MTDSTDNVPGPDYPDMGKWARMGIDGEAVDPDDTANPSLGDLFTSQARDMGALDAAMEANAKRIVHMKGGHQILDRWTQLLIDFMALDRIVRGERAGWPWPESEVPPTIQSKLEVVRSTLGSAA